MLHLHLLLKCAHTSGTCAALAVALHLVQNLGVNGVLEYLIFLADDGGVVLDQELPHAELLIFFVQLQLVDKVQLDARLLEATAVGRAHGAFVEGRAEDSVAGSVVHGASDKELLRSVDVVHDLLPFAVRGLVLRVGQNALRGGEFVEGQLVVVRAAVLELVAHARARLRGAQRPLELTGLRLRLLLLNFGLLLNASGVQILLVDLHVAVRHLVHVGGVLAAEALLVLPVPLDE